MTGYRVEIPESRLYAAFGMTPGSSCPTADFPTETTVVGVVGAEDTLTLRELKSLRAQTVAFELAKLLVDDYLTENGQRRPWLFPQVLRLTRRWLAEQVDYHDGTYPGLLRVAQKARQAAEKIMRRDHLAGRGAGTSTVLPVLRTFDAVGRTGEVDFFTTKSVFGTSPRSHVNFVTLDGKGGNAWERAVAQALDMLPGVAAYVKNDHLGFSIPYTLRRHHAAIPPRLPRPARGRRRRRCPHVDRRGVRRPEGPRPDPGEGCDRPHELGCPPSTITATSGCGATARSGPPRSPGPGPC